MYNVTHACRYDTLGPDAVDHILGHAEVEAVACSEAVLPSILECLPQRPAVKLVVSTAHATVCYPITSDFHSMLKSPRILLIFLRLDVYAML